MRRCTFLVEIVSIRSIVKYSVFGWKFCTTENETLMESKTKIKLNEGKGVVDSRWQIATSLPYNHTYADKFIVFTVMSSLQSKPDVIRYTSKVEINLAEIANNKQQSVEREYLLKGDQKHIYATIKISLQDNAGLNYDAKKNAFSVRQITAQRNPEQQEGGGRQMSNEMSNETAALKQKLLKTESNLRQLESEYSGLHAIIAEKDNQLYLWQIEMDALREKNTQFAKNANKNTNTNLQTEIDELKMKLQAAELKNTQLQLSQLDLMKTSKEYVSLLEKYNKLNASASALSKEKEENESRWKKESRESKQQIKLLQSELNALRMEITQWEQGYDQQQRKLNAYRVRIKEGSASNSNGAQSKEYESIIAKYVQKEEAMKRNLQIIEEETNNVYNILQQKQINEERLIQMLQARQDQLQQQKELLSRSQKLLALEREKNANLERQISVSMGINAKSPGDSPGSHKEQELIQKNQNLLALLNENVLKLIQHDKLKRQSAKSKRIIEEKNLKIEDLSTEVKQHKDKIAFLMKENKRMIQCNNKLGNDINKSNAIINKLQVELKEMKAANQVLTQQNKEKQFKLERRSSNTAKPGLDNANQNQNQNQSSSLTSALTELIDILGRRTLPSQTFEQIERRRQEEERMDVRCGNVIALQQKIRSLSKENTKFKAYVLKNKTRSMSQKSEIVQSMKPIDGILQQIASLCQQITSEIGGGSTQQFILK